MTAASVSWLSERSYRELSSLDATAYALLINLLLERSVLMSRVCKSSSISISSLLRRL